MAFKIILLAFSLNCVNAYSRSKFSINNMSTTEQTLECNIYQLTTSDNVTPQLWRRTEARRAKKVYKDPYTLMKAQLDFHLYGGEKHDQQHQANKYSGVKVPLKMNMTNVFEESDAGESTVQLPHYPDGQIMRADIFNKKSGVHFPPRDYFNRDYMMLNVTDDYMQTAVNAFAILLEGTVKDVENLPPDYVLKSARAISMMKLTREKLAALWTVVKKGRSTNEVKYEELEMYRPLFRFVNAREIGRLNLQDMKILNFIGTHAELNRHQMGVVASKYIKLNPEWSHVKYLNHMNNLLCGVPMNFMRKVSSETYLRLSHQVFYHIRACDPLQRKFYLAMMTKTEALGKSYSWSAQDVSRLGLLLGEVPGRDLASINPESMAGITAQVMMEIPPENMDYFTDVQVQYLAIKPLSIFAKKIKAYHDSIENNCASNCIISWTTLFSIDIIILKVQGI